MEDSHWLIAAVGLGLLAYSLVAIIVNGFNWHLLFPLLMGLINLFALYTMKR